MSRGREGVKSRARLAVVIGAAGVCAALALPASGQAVTAFGAKLIVHGTGVQPSNAGYDSCHFADPSLTGGPCTRIAVQFGDIGAIGGNTTAPKNGTIREIKLIAATTGVMVPYVAEVRNLKLGANKAQAKVTAKGPKIDYASSIHGLNYKVQTFHVHMKVNKGEYVGLRARKTSMLRCNGGSVAQLLFQPPLQIGNPFVTSAGTDDCVLLIQAVYG